MVHQVMTMLIRMLLIYLQQVPKVIFFNYSTTDCSALMNMDPEAPLRPAPSLHKAQESNALRAFNALERRFGWHFRTSLILALYLQLTLSDDEHLQQR
jgi:hypothetical protein